MMSLIRVTNINSRVSTLEYNVAQSAGQVAYFARTTAPAGWLKCNGATLSRTAYAALFNSIGIQFGAPDASSFQIPDLRGEFLRCWDDGRAVDRENNVNRAFGTWQPAAMLNHTHYGVTSSMGAHTHTGTAKSAGDHKHTVDLHYWNVNGSYTITSSGESSYKGTTNTNITGAHTHELTIDSAGQHTHSMTTGNPSEGGGNETRPRNIALLACIKY